ncbi:transcriptional repressor [[Mycoplasma] testudinis]|uniref:transcriptional repressor n=1 Tax=[Mycoplasma] testudinis TaxID=33924 RepID=UPI00048A0104|nr:transcriptional repressor [[Mycoplasma] testudinis]
MRDYENNHKLDFYIDKLTSQKMRVTSQRKSVLKCLIDHQGWHTVEDLISHMESTEGSKPNTASVYNTLHSFVKLGLVQAFLEVNTFKIYFNIRHDSHEHAYFFNTKNASFSTLPFPDKLAKQISLFFKSNKIDVHDYYLVATSHKKNKNEKDRK